MPSEIAKIETIDYSALDAAIGNDDGDPFRFKDGVFTRGFDKDVVPLGTRFDVHPASTAAGFQRWEDGRPTDTRIRMLNDPKALPIFRQALGDDDEKQWPDGKDPWQRIMMIAMRDADGARLTFSTSSVGGENAIRSLLRDFRLIRHNHPGQVPVVEIGCGSYEHRIHRTTVKFPTFSIVDRTTWEGEEQPSQPEQKALPPAKRAKMVKDELDDDLPDWAVA